VRALALVHERSAGPGVFGEEIRARGAQLDEWFVPDGSAPPNDPHAYDAVLAFGGGMHVDQHDDHPWLVPERTLLRELLQRGVPLLGVCLGAQLLAEAVGGPARPAARPEVGWREVEVTAAGARDPLLGPMAPRFRALEWHSYEFLLGPGAASLASNATCLQAFRVGGRAWGIQFHAEVTLTDFEGWIDEERTPEELVHLGFEPESLRASVRASIEEWNERGRGLCGRFLDVAMA